MKIISVKKSSTFVEKFMKKLSNVKGFTLIELAIVMVIIGIILGAVLKGQDLIVNARAKQVVVWEKEWETAQWTYFDRKGTFAGDTNSNGVIADEASPTSPITTITGANFVNAPSETKTVGSITLYMKMGNDTVSSTSKNVILICPADACGTAIATDELAYFEAIDTALDGTANAGTGNVRGGLLRRYHWKHPMTLLMEQQQLRIHPVGIGPPPIMV